MLVLTRKAKEAVIIKTTQGDVRLHWEPAGPHRVKLVFDAPRDIRILRAELEDSDQAFHLHPS